LGLAQLFLILRGGFMTIAQMLEQSGVLTLLGMGVVFSFLVILVIVVSLVGKIFHIAGNVQPTAAVGTAPAGDAAITAAISAAVNEYQKTR
jgi:oxaloacetate decarboxylase gamma subunit